MAALGSLVVKLALEYAQYSQGLSKSEQEALASAKRIQDTMDSVRASVATSVGTIVGTIAAGLSINAFKNLIAGTVESNAALNDLAIQANTTVEALSGLVSIGKYSDVGAEQITGSMNKLTKNLASASEESRGTARAVQALGLDLDKFRQSKPEDQMLAVAKALGEFEDGASKSAVAMALYGKEGAKLLPFMKDLAEVGELQAKITTAQAAAADSLSDNMTRLRTSGDAWKKELANAMIPALDQGVQAVLGLVNGTGGLRAEVQRLAADGSIQQWTTDAITGLSYVVDAGEYVWRVIKTITLGVAGLTAGSVQMLQGNFRGAAEAFSASWDDITKTFDSDTMGAKFRARLAEVKAMGDQAVKTRKELKFDDTAEPKAKKEGESEYDKLVGRILERISLSQEELLVGRQLTEAEKFRLKVLADMEAAGKKLTDAERARIQALLDEAEAADLELQMGRALIAQAKELASARQQARNADYTASARAIEQLQEEWTKSTASVNDRIRSLTAEAEAAEVAARLNISLAEAVERVTIARLREKQEGFWEGSDGWQALEREIQAREHLLGLLAQRERFDQHRRMWESIDQTAHDVWTNVFQGGQDMWTKLKNTGKAVFFDWLYSMTLKRWIISIGTSVGGMGASSMASAATGAGGGGVMGSLSSLSSLSNLATLASTGYAGLVGSSVGSIFGATAGNAALGTSLGLGAGSSSAAALAAAQAGGTATAASGTMASLGSGIAMAAPYVLAAVVIANALGLFKKTKKVGGGIGGTVGEGGELFGYDLMRKSGSLFSGPKYSVRQNALDAVTAQGIQDAVAGMLTQARSQAGALGLGGNLASFRGQLGSDLIHPDTGGYGIKLDGLSAEQAQAKIQAEVTKLADTMASQALGDLAGVFAKAGETASQTLTRLTTSLASVNDMLKALDAQLYQSSAAGADMASQLADAFGGLDRMASATAAYRQAFYSESERNAIDARQVTEALASLGFALPASREQFRALVEAQDLTTDSGRQAYASLIGLSGAFDALQTSSAGLTDQLTALAGEVQQVFAPLLDQIRGAREGVASAVAGINPAAVLTPEQILGGIASASVAAPTSAGVAAAQARLSETDRLVAAARAGVEAAKVQALPGSTAIAAASEDLQRATASLSSAQALRDRREAELAATPQTVWTGMYFDEGWQNNPAYAEVLQAAQAARQQLADTAAYQRQVQAAYDALVSQAAAVNDALVAQAQARFDAAQDAMASAQQAQLAAQNAYAASVRQFVVDAGASVDKLTGLRDEVAKYYEAQKALADNMLASAARLREAASGVRMSQLDAFQTASSLASQYHLNYSMALATTGATQAAYADKLAQSLPALSEALKATAATQADWVTATAKLVGQGNAVAGLLEAGAPADYQQQSIALLGEIDSALLALSEASNSAEHAISEAIYATGAQNLAGLRAVVAVLKGEAVPAFADGGLHGGGLRLVGERGPELEVTGPSRIFSAADTRRLLAGSGGDTAALEAEVRTLREENRAQARALVQMQTRMTRLLERWDAVGMPTTRVT